jgi:RHS repeat-associated protein
LAVSPLGAYSYGYDSLNRLTSITDGKSPSQTTSYAYDGSSTTSMDRLDTITYQGGATISYGYDDDGNVTSMQDASGTTNYSYDKLNRLTQETQPGAVTINYTYYPGGELQSITENSKSTTYCYDQADRLTAIHVYTSVVTNCASPPGGAETITYNYTGETLSSITYPGGASVVSTFDTSGRLLSVTNKNASGTTVASYTYTYTWTDNSSATQDGALKASVTPLSGTTEYNCYDPVGRLASAGATSSSCPSSGPPWGNSSAPYQYSYDANGNLTGQTINTTSTFFTVNAANEINTSGNSFDGNGNQTASAADSFTYNAKEQTSSITPAGGTALTGSYSGPGQTRRTAFGSLSFLNDLLGTGRSTVLLANTDYTRDPDGTVLAENAGGSHYYFAFDGLGSVVGLFDASGNYCHSGGTSCTSGGSNYTALYEPYGKLTNPPGSGYPAFNYRYAGYWYDSQTETSGHSGLYKIGARYYDPNISRWTQRDPLDNPLQLSGWNRYSYAGDDPINMTDPSGLLFGWLKHAVHHVSHWVRHHAYESLFAVADLAFCAEGAEVGAALGSAAGGIGAVPGAVAGCLVNGLAEHVIVHHAYEHIRNSGG